MIDISLESTVKRKNRKKQNDFCSKKFIMTGQLSGWGQILFRGQAPLPPLPTGAGAGRTDKRRAKHNLLGGGKHHCVSS